MKVARKAINAVLPSIYYSFLPTMNVRLNF